MLKSLLLISFKSSTSIPNHKLLIKSKSPGISAKSIVIKSLNPVKERITLAFNREVQNGVFVASESLSDIFLIKNKLLNNSNLEIIKLKKYNPQLIIHSLPSGITKEDIEDSIKSVSSVSPDSIKIIPYS